LPISHVVHTTSLVRSMFRRKLTVKAPSGRGNTTAAPLASTKSTVRTRKVNAENPLTSILKEGGEALSVHQSPNPPFGRRYYEAPGTIVTQEHLIEMALRGNKGGNSVRGQVPKPTRAYLTHTQDGRDVRHVGNNRAVIGDYLAGKEGTQFMKRIAAMPAYIPPQIERDPTEGIVMSSPTGGGRIKYKWWCKPYTDRFGAFAAENAELINKVSADQIIDVLAITAKAFSYSRTENLSMHTYNHHNMRESSLFTAKSLRYLGCLRKPMKGNEFTVTTATGEWMFDYVYNYDNSADREFFIHFVRAMMARGVKDDWLEKLVLDSDMSKYKTMPSDAMLKNEGMVALRAQRDYRTQSLHAHKEIKMSMTTTSTIPCTVDKFAFGDDPGGTVMVYGSGNTMCAMRYNWSKTYCVDPLYDGPTDRGYKGTLTTFHQHVSNGIIKLNFKPTLITSDACAYIDQKRTLLVGARGNHELRDLTRAMDPERTNKLSAEIVSFWINQGYTGDFYMKSGVHNFYPPIFSEMVVKGTIKTRPTNAEVVVHLSGTTSELDDGKSDTPGPELTWARAVNRHNIVIYVANNQRMIHEKERSFPKRAFGFPANMDTLLRNARANVILKPPPPCVIVNKREITERKKMERGVDFDDIEHSSDTFGTMSDSEESDVEDYYN